MLPTVIVPSAARSASSAVITAMVARVGDGRGTLGSPRPQLGLVAIASASARDLWWSPGSGLNRPDVAAGLPKSAGSARARRPRARGLRGPRRSAVRRRSQRGPRSWGHRAMRLRLSCQCTRGRAEREQQQWWHDVVHCLEVAGRRADHGISAYRHDDARVSACSDLHRRASARPAGRSINRTSGKNRSGRAPAVNHDPQPRNCAPRLRATDTPDHRGALCR